MRLLVVDDSEDARDILVATLIAGGYEDVVECGSGPDALRRLGVGDPDAGTSDIDLILLDIVMPGMDGIECAARIRKDNRLADVPVVMVTSMDDMSSLAQAFVAGANDYVVKPFQKVELLVRVRNALKLKGELDRRLAREESLEAAVAELKKARAPVNAAVDPRTAFLTAGAFEDVLRSGAMTIGWVGLLQIDSLDRFREQYGAHATQGITARLYAALAITRGPMGAVLSAYEEGTAAIALPPLTAAVVHRTLENTRDFVFQLNVPHRDSQSGAKVTVSGGFAPYDGRAPGRSLANAFSALAQATSEGGNRLVQFEEPLL